MHRRCSRVCWPRCRLFSVLVLLLSTVALDLNAATLSAEAKILSIEYTIPDSVSFEFQEQAQSFIASGLTNSGFASEDFSPYVNSIPGTVSARSQVGASVATADASAAVETGAEARVERAGDAEALGQVELPYRSSGTGIVSVEARVRLAIEVIEALASESAEAMVIIRDTNGEERTLELLYESPDTELNLRAGALPQVVEETLRLSIPVDGVNNSHLVFQAFSKVDSGVVPVPLPAAFGLFLGGLVFSAIARQPLLLRALRIWR